MKVNSFLIISGYHLMVHLIGVVNSFAHKPLESFSITIINSKRHFHIPWWAQKEDLKLKKSLKCLHLKIPEG
jgi:hypothetical protein